jgi:hypothetical protein
MKHIHTFESFLNESNINEANVPVTDWIGLGFQDYWKEAKKLKYAQLADAMSELIELYRTTGNSDYEKVYGSVYNNVFIYKVSEIIATNKPLESDGKGRYGNGAHLFGKFADVEKKNLPIRVKTLKVDSFSGKNVNVTILDGSIDVKRSGGYYLTTDFKESDKTEIKGSADIFGFIEDFWIYTEEGKQWKTQFPDKI